MPRGAERITGKEGDTVMDIGVTVAAGKPEVNVVSLSGRLDATTYEAAQPAIVEALEKGSAGMILNMGALDFISSAGLRTMLVVWKKATADGKKIAMVGVQPPIYKIFKIAALDKVFRFFDNEGEAIREMWP
jgi:anti-anti-sigma factor